MLNLFHAPDLETLGELACSLLMQPQSDPFAPARIVVPSQGMGRWLTLQLARRQGIAMQLEMQLPASFIWDLSRQVLGQLPEQSAFTPQSMSWRLYDWLCEEDNLQRSPRLAHYLKGGDERRRLSLAGKIADVFDQYLLYRDDWLAAWERGELCQLGVDEDWQALLWRELTRDGHPHRARLLGDLLSRLYREQPIEGLPERILVFGISSLPPHHLRVLAGLARHTDVILFAINPCREAWGEIRDINELARHAELDPDDWYLEVGNPLLAILGKQGRDFFDTLFALASEDNAQETGIYPSDDELQDDSLLHALQHDILRLQTRLPDERLPFTPGDRSLELHVAHSPLREVEILHDQLLARFAADPTLTPDQVVVLTPDIERYAPYIDAIFSARDSSTPRIPYSLADRSLRAEIPLLDSFLSLLNLPNSRFTAEEVLTWLEQPALAARAGIEADDLPLLRDWLREAGVRWGRDGDHRTSLGLPGDQAFTWSQGLDRLLLGFCLPAQLAADQPPLLGDCWPLDAVEGTRAQLLGRLSAFVKRLQLLARELGRPRSLADWSLRLQQLIDELFDEREAGDPLVLLSQACNALAEQAAASGMSRLLSLDLLQQPLASLLNQNSKPSGFLTGAVTFCTMVPMRSLPFRHVCLLGLDDGALPRRTPTASFDLIARKPRRGDRSRRLDDRYLLLETLLCARDGLYLSYVGRDPRSNAELPPSVLISELLEVAEQTVCCDEGSVGPYIRIEHPLQPFSPNNFAAPPHSSFARNWFNAAVCLSQPARPLPVFAQPLPLPEGDWQTLTPDQLLLCFRHPARFLLEQRLGLRLPQVEEALAGDEPFTPDRRALHSLRQLALLAAEKGWDEPSERRVAAAAGILPVGELGQAHWGQLRGPIRAFAPTLFEQRPDGAAQPLLVDVRLAGLHIHGWLDGVSQEGLFDYRLNDLAARDLAGFWLRHLLLNIAATPDIARQSRLLSPRANWYLGSQSNPHALLEPWLLAYRQALCSPLPVHPRSSYAFAAKWRRPGKKEPIDAARMEARVKWIGSDFMLGEGQNPWNLLAFRGLDPLDEQFELLAEQLYGPALDAIEEAQA